MRRPDGAYLRRDAERIPIELAPLEGVFSDGYEHWASGIRLVVFTSTGQHVVKSIEIGDDGIIDIRLGPAFDVDGDAPPMARPAAPIGR